jgi:hypothetical protein
MAVVRAKIGNGLDLCHRALGDTYGIASLLYANLRTNCDLRVCHDQILSEVAPVVNRISMAYSLKSPVFVANVFIRDPHRPMYERLFFAIFDRMNKDGQVVMHSGKLAHEQWGVLFVPFCEIVRIDFDLDSKPLRSLFDVFRQFLHHLRFLLASPAGASPIGASPLWVKGRRPLRGMGQSPIEVNPSLVKGCGILHKTKSFS